MYVIIKVKYDANSCLMVIAGNGTSCTETVSMVVKIGLLSLSAKKLRIVCIEYPNEQQIITNQKTFSIILLHSVRYLNPWIVVTSRYSEIIGLIVTQKFLLGITLSIKEQIIFRSLWSLSLETIFCVGPAALENCKSSYRK